MVSSVMKTSSVPFTDIKASSGIRYVRLNAFLTTGDHPSWTTLFLRSMLLILIKISSKNQSTWRSWASSSTLAVKRTISSFVICAACRSTHSCLCDYREIFSIRTEDIDSWKCSLSAPAASFRKESEFALEISTTHSMWQSPNVFLWDSEQALRSIHLCFLNLANQSAQSLLSPRTSQQPAFLRKEWAFLHKRLRLCSLRGDVPPNRHKCSWSPVSLSASLPITTPHTSVPPLFFSAVPLYIPLQSPSAQ